MFLQAKHGNCAFSGTVVGLLVLCKILGMLERVWFGWFVGWPLLANENLYLYL